MGDLCTLMTYGHTPYLEHEPVNLPTQVRDLKLLAKHLLLKWSKKPSRIAVPVHINPEKLEIFQ